MLGYGDPLQYSIFFCELSPTEQAIMESAILRVVRPSVDSVLIVNLGPASGVAAGRIRTLGTASLPSRQRFQIV